MTHFVSTDIGNSAIHAASVCVAEHETEVQAEPTTLVLDGPDAATDGLLQRLPKDMQWWTVCVNRSRLTQLTVWLEARRPGDSVRQLTHHHSPIALRVDSPEKLGMDRVAAAVAANELRQPHAAALVIDSGTAITVDVVDPQGVFLGGAILPGVRMSAAALNEGTDGLPQIAPHNDPPHSIGANTEAAIRSGLFWGSFGGVKELIDQHRARLDAPVDVFLTGGAAVWSELLADAHLVPNLTLRGVARMATHARNRVQP